MRTHITVSLRIGMVLVALGSHPSLQAVPTVFDPNLAVEPVVSGLSQPTGIAFLGDNDFFAIEKASGLVKRFTNGVPTIALDLPVSSGSERGLLGIALSPNFAADSAVYFYWTESTTGADTNVAANTPLLGNRVDRYLWNGSTFTFDQNLIRLRARQADQGQPERGNHNGGVLRFGPDGKLYVMIGDEGRRGQLQNLPAGPAMGGPDDQFGGPAPDDAHFTGAILRLNTDGAAPADNPFFAAGASLGGEVGANVQTMFAYGFRNSFGMAFDPAGGDLWMADNGDDAFDELNRVEPGMNGGWIQTMGPIDRVAEFKEIEVNEFGGGLQQIRWPPSLIADTPAEAMSGMFMLPGATYSDPEFSWKYGVAPAAVGFQVGEGLGTEYAGDLFVGAARTTLDEGYLFRFELDGPRDGIAPSDPDLADLVADNTTKLDITESESLRFGAGFGIATDIQTAPDGSLYVVSLSDGAIYRIYAKAAIPEPGSLGLLVLIVGCCGLRVLRRVS